MVIFQGHNKQGIYQKLFCLWNNYVCIIIIKRLNRYFVITPKNISYKTWGNLNY